MIGRTLWQEALDNDLQRLGYMYQETTATWMLAYWRRGDEKMSRRRNACDQKRETRYDAEEKSRQMVVSTILVFAKSIMPNTWRCFFST